MDWYKLKPVKMQDINTTKVAIQHTVVGNVHGRFDIFWRSRGSVGWRSQICNGIPSCASKCKPCFREVAHVDVFKNVCKPHMHWNSICLRSASFVVSGEISVNGIGFDIGPNGKRVALLRPLLPIIAIGLSGLPLGLCKMRWARHILRCSRRRRTSAIQQLEFGPTILAHASRSMTPWTNAPFPNPNRGGASVVILIQELGGQ